MVEHLTFDQTVIGSIPVALIHKNKIFFWILFISYINTQIRKFENRLYKYYLKVLNLLYHPFAHLSTELVENILLKTVFVQEFYKLTELIWEEGFLIDFLQKKVVDKWIRKFLINSSYIFNERFLFDYIILYFSKNILWRGHLFVIFEFTSVLSTLTTTLILFVTFTLFLALYTITLVLL